MSFCLSSDFKIFSSEKKQKTFKLRPKIVDQNLSLDKFLHKIYFEHHIPNDNETNLGQETDGVA